MIAAEGEFDWSGKAPKSLMEDRSIPSAARIGPDMLGYAWTDLAEIPYLELQKTQTTVNNRIDQPYVCDQPIRLSAEPIQDPRFWHEPARIFWRARDGSHAHQALLHL